MKKAPWARFATRMSPKMREKPEESRKSSPPRARPFSDWMRKKRTRSSLLDVLRFREASRVHRALEELLRREPPELAHLRVRLHDGVDEAARPSRQNDVGHGNDLRRRLRCQGSAGRLT